jgi:hypothetical protein
MFICTKNSTDCMNILGTYNKKSYESITVLLSAFFFLIKRTLHLCHFQGFARFVPKAAIRCWQQFRTQVLFRLLLSLVVLMRISCYYFQHIQILETVQKSFISIKLSLLTWNSYHLSSLMWCHISIINVHKTLMKPHWDWPKFQVISLSPSHQFLDACMEH